MPASAVSPALQQFVDDEMLRAPLLFDQLVEGTMDHARKALPALPPLQRSAIGDLMQALLQHQARLADYFMRSLEEQVRAELSQARPVQAGAAAKPAAKKPTTLALVDEDEVALDVELSHTIEAIKSTAEYELRELQAFVSALVGDLDVARDHNPFRAETWARAAWAAAQALPLSRGHQVAFLRHASTPLAQLLRRSYAAACSRLEGMGIEPASYRTMILPAGSRRGARPGETTFSPDLYRMRETMPAPMDSRLSYDGQLPDAGARRERWTDIARHTSNRVDRQAIELVSRLFDAMQADERVPRDVGLLISRLHGPAMRLTLRDGDMLDQDKHPLWRFVNRLAYEAEMAPDPDDPERVRLLKVAQATIDQLASEPEQTSALYKWANERLDGFLRQRLTRRLTAAASHVGALQKLEDKLAAGHTVPSTLHGMLDVPHLDTVPAELIPETPPTAPVPAEGAARDAWLDELQPGHWVRMFLQGRWVHAQLLWPGERREIWLFGDGASDATWAVRRAALALMREQGLLKGLKQRSIVGTAAARVQQQVSSGAAA
ncbi:MAG: DUF1631 family protein [Rubrivivax sp.]|nr:DUF1631 family protein [Rubrivivax sp.]